MEKKEAMKILKDFYDKSALFSIRTALDTVIPELKESEGERIRERLIAFLSQCKALYGDSFQQFGLNIDEALAWVEKQGEQKPAWSEEDEEIHRKCICAMRASACGFPEEEKFVEQVDNWFKSLKKRYTWKPSEEQMELIKDIVFKDRRKITRKELAIFHSIYNDLKKLMEE